MKTLVAVWCPVVSAWQRMTSKKRFLPAAPGVDCADSASSAVDEVVNQGDDLADNADRDVVLQTLKECTGVTPRRSFVGTNGQSFDEAQGSEDIETPDCALSLSSTPVNGAVGRTTSRRRVREAGEQRLTIWNAMQHRDATWRSTATSAGARVTASANSTPVGITSSQLLSSVQTLTAIRRSRSRPQTTDAVVRRDSVTGRGVTGDQTWQMNGEVSGTSTRKNSDNGTGTRSPSTTRNSAAISKAHRAISCHLPQSTSHEVTRSKSTSRSRDKLLDVPSCDRKQVTNTTHVGRRFVASSLSVVVAASLVSINEVNLR